jgi:hypothetical protein
MDGEAFARLNELRQRYYPPERNTVPAHLTLFRELPGGRSREIKALLRQVALKQKPIDIPPGEVKLIERGVAVFVRSPQLYGLRHELANEWEIWLSAADLADFQPHVTIQNNVSEAEARRTRDEIAATFRPPRIRGIGFHLWRYRDRFWDHVQMFPFG